MRRCALEVDDLAVAHAFAVQAAAHVDRVTWLLLRRQTPGCNVRTWCEADERGGRERPQHGAPSLAPCAARPAGGQAAHHASARVRSGAVSGSSLLRRSAGTRRKRGRGGCSVRAPPRRCRPSTWRLSLQQAWRRGLLWRERRATPLRVRVAAAAGAARRRFRAAAQMARRRVTWPRTGTRSELTRQLSARLGTTRCPETSLCRRGVLLQYRQGGARLPCAYPRQLSAAGARDDGLTTGGGAARRRPVAAAATATAYSSWFQSSKAVRCLTVGSATRSGSKAIRSAEQVRASRERVTQAHPATA